MDGYHQYMYFFTEDENTEDENMEDENMEDENMENMEEYHYNENIGSVIDRNDNCQLINNRKVEYYKYFYDPSRIIDYLRNNFKNLGKKYVEDLDEIFELDVDSKTLRANCIVFALYRVHFLDSKRSLQYLITILKNIEIIGKYLPNWLVRIYLDRSVLPSNKKMIQYDNEIYLVLEKILNSKNVEVYTYFCQSFTKNIHMVRSLRFLPFLNLIEGRYGINISLSREADGIISNLDIYHIMKFEEDLNIFYIIPLFSDSDHREGINNILYQSYSRWLTFYKISIERSFFSKYNNIYDLLAGTLGIKLKVKESYFYTSYDKLKQIINEADYSNVPLSQYHFIENNFTESDLENEEIQIELKEAEKKIKKLVEQGFDEVFLLHLFRKIISPQIIEYDKNLITSIYYNKDKYQLILSVIRSSNIMININVNNSFEYLSELSNLNIEYMY